MITFNNLGQLGRLGNQLFQYASTKGIAAKNNQEFMVPRTELFDHFEMAGANIGRRNSPVFQENDFHFDEELFSKFQYDVDLFG
ncbi:alpha-1,2-fucosyltransferase, partial [bacterium]|nr:alpha-1,2-fucosyltransferase [bacterium]